MESCGMTMRRTCSFFSTHHHGRFVTWNVTWNVTWLDKNQRQHQTETAAAAAAAAEATAEKKAAATAAEAVEPGKAHNNRGMDPGPQATEGFASR